VAKSSIVSPIQEAFSPIQEALTNALKITENHNVRVAIHQLFTSTQKKTALQAVNNCERCRCQTVFLNDMTAFYQKMPI